MIVRSKRSQSRLRTEQHRHLQARVDDLQAENKALRRELLQLQQRCLQSEAARKKYKAKYRDAKQKLEILTMVGHLPKPALNDPYQLCLSPKTKTTRIRTISEEEFHSLRAGLALSEFNSQAEGKAEEGEHSSKRCVTAASTMKEIETDCKEEGKGEAEAARIIEHLLQLQQQLQALSQRIEGRSQSESRVLELQGHLYRRMEEVSDKISKMEVRDLQRESRRAVHERQKSTRRFNSSMKAVERIGRDLLGFKVDQ